jgi:RNA polymerase sigma factor (sigma-70 family)
MPKNQKTETCDEITFTNFFKTHAKGLRNFLIYKFGNEEKAADMAQDAFLKLWQNCADVPLEKAKSYVYTIAKNGLLNTITHEKMILRYKSNFSVADQTNENPEFLLEEKQYKDKLLNAIESLNETQKTAFLMHRIDGKKYHEIAEELNIGVKAVEKRIHIALVELRKKIDNI